MQEFVFGPVPSRRLGFSLGVDIIPRKYCSFDCIYCQVGKTTHKEVERRSFSDPGLIVKQVVERVEEGRRIDFISLSGSGEPTLSADIGEIIRAYKAEDLDSPRGDHEWVAALQGRCAQRYRSGRRGAPLPRCDRGRGF